MPDNYESKFISISSFFLYAVQASLPFVLALVVSLFQVSPELLQGETLSLIAYDHLEHLFPLALTCSIISGARLGLLSSINAEKFPLRVPCMILLAASQLFSLSYIKFIFSDQLLYLILAWFGLGYVRLKLFDYQRKIASAIMLASEVGILTIASLMVTFDNFVWGFCYFASLTATFSLARGLLYTQHITISNILRAASIFVLSFLGVLGLLPKGIILVIIGVKYAKISQARTHDLMIAAVISCLLIAILVN